MLPPGNILRDLGIDLQSYADDTQLCISIWHISISPIDKLVHCMYHRFHRMYCSWTEIEERTCNYWYKCPVREAVHQLSLTFFDSHFCTRALSLSGRLWKGFCMSSPLAGLITIILSCLVYPGKAWNADDLKCSSRCAGQVQRQRTLYTCFKVLSLRADFKILLLVFESFNLLILSMAWVSDMLMWYVPLFGFYARTRTLFVSICKQF